mgnify:FL=1
MNNKDIKFDIVQPAGEEPAELPTPPAEEPAAPVVDAPEATEEDAPAEEASEEAAPIAESPFLNEDDLAISWSSFKDFFNSPTVIAAVRDNWRFFLLLTVLSLVYIGLGYVTREKLVENDQLSTILLDRRYRALTQSAELRERTLGSKLEHQLEDTTLRTSKERSFELKVPKLETK